MIRRTEATEPARYAWPGRLVVSVAKGDNRNGSVLYVVAIASFLAFAMFSHLLSQAVSYALLAAGFIMSAWLCFVRGDGFNFDMRRWGTQSFWLLYLVCIVVSFCIGEGLRIADCASLVAFISAVFLLSVTEEWMPTFVNVAIVLLSLFMVSTIAMYLSPDLAVNIRNTLLSDLQSYMGYQSGIASHYSINGHFNAMGTIICVTLAAFSKGTAWKKMPLWVLSALFFWALLLTNKRTAFVCILFVFAILFLTSKATGKIFKIVLFVAIGGYCLLAFGSSIPGFENLVDRFNEALAANTIDEATSGRGQLWEYALKGFSDSYLIGNGWSSYEFHWPNGYTVSSIAHNELLNSLYEIGLIGTIIMLVCVISTLYATYQMMNSAGRSECGVLLRMSFALQVYYCLYGFTMGAILSSPDFFAFYLFAVAIMLALKASRFSGKAYRDVPSRHLRLVSNIGADRA